MLTSTSISSLIRGSSFFTTGGGVSYKSQMKTVSKLIDPKISLLSPDDLSKDSYIFTCGEVGPANSPEMNKQKIVISMFESLKQITHKNFIGIYPIEIGQESVTIESAYYLNLPIVDLDITGFRAVPIMDINIFNLKNIPFSYTPLVLSTNEGKMIDIKKKLSLKKTEETIREFTKHSKSGVVFLLGGVVDTNSILNNKLFSKSYSKAIKYGKIENYSSLQKTLKPRIVIDGTVIEKKEKKKIGFLFEEVIIKNADAQIFKLIILNEALFLKKEEKLLASIPERILLIDSEKLLGIPSGEIRKGMKINILVLDPEKEWNSAKGKRLFGHARFKHLKDN